MNKALKVTAGVSLFLTLVLAGSLAARAEGSDFRVEGVISGMGSDPDQLSALINGELYSAGDEIGDYELDSVAMDSVTLRHRAGGEALTLAVGHQPEIAEPTAPEPVEKPWWEAALEKHFPGLYRFSQNLSYAGLVNDLRKVHMSAMIHVLESGDDLVSIPQLVAEGSLPAFMSKPREDGYQFRIMSAQGGVRVYAEPVEAPAGRKYFLIDEHSYIYAEDGRRATPESPRFDGGGFEIHPK